MAAPEPVPPTGQAGKKYVLGLDVGTTGIRCGLVDRGGVIRHKVYEPLSVQRPFPGRSEIDAEALFSTAVSLFRRCLSEFGVCGSSGPVPACNGYLRLMAGHGDSPTVFCDESHAVNFASTQAQPEEVASIGISTLRGTFTTWNQATGEILHPLITWQDTRASDIVHELNGSCLVKATRVLYGLADRVYSTPRNHIISTFAFDNGQASVRLLWALQNIPAVADAARAGTLCFGTCDTYLVWRLTGKTVHATDLGCISGTGLFDMFTLRFSDIIMHDILKLPRGIHFPDIRDTAGSFGATDPALLGAAIPITAVAGDQQASMFGQCCFERGDTKITLGTGAFANINTGAVAGAGVREGVRTFVAWRIGDSTRYMCEARSGNAALVLEWGRRFGLYDDARSTEAVARAVPHTEGATFAAAFTGLDTPHNDGSARGAIMGLSPTVTRPHIVRALLENIAFTTEELHATVVEGFRPTPGIRIDGGVSHNSFVVETLATLLQQPIARPAETESTLLGAVYLSGLACGFWPSQAALLALRPADTVFAPLPAGPFLERSRGAARCAAACW